MENLKTIITNEKVKGAIAILAAVIMWFTPTHIDVVIEALLAAFGIQKLVLKKNESGGCAIRNFSKYKRRACVSD